MCILKQHFSYVRTDENQPHFYLPVLLREEEEGRRGGGGTGLLMVE